MDEEKKLRYLADVFEVDAAALDPKTKLAHYERWDSLAALSFLVLLNDAFGRQISGREIRGLATIQDMLDLIGD